MRIKYYKLVHLEKQNRKKKKKERRLKPPPVLAGCKGLSVTAAFYQGKGKQQDSTWGPVKGYSSWKSNLAHGPECTVSLIFRAVGAHSIFTGCVSAAGTALHADADAGPARPQVDHTRLKLAFKNQQRCQTTGLRGRVRK